MPLLNDLSWLTTLLVARPSITWHLFPLALVIALVYNASRYELPEKILERALKHLGIILLLMGVVFAVLFLLSYGL